MSKSHLISERTQELQLSLTLEISARAKLLKKEGKDICSLSAGEPDFDTPNYIVNAAIEALRNGITRYGPAAGDPELREAIAQKLTTSNNVPSKAENILITNGGKQAIFNLFQIILNPGDEVLIPSPYWLSYPEIAKLAGAIPVPLHTSPKDGFKLSSEKLEEKITNRTKLLILNSPCNPTGRVIQKEELISIAEVLRRNKQLLVMTDEIYEYLISENESHHSLAAIAPDLRERIFIVNGFAKAWAMTGWRIGYLAGPKEFIKTAIALQSQSTSNVCSFAQRGALAALLGPKESIKTMSRSYNERREILTKGLNSINGISLIPQKGAFYAFPELAPSLPNSLSFCKLALEKVGLAIIPGIAFGEDRCVRLSCAVSEDTIKEGIARLEKLITQLI
ncbi:pyridoxal phosphate-dependent aminotransferase [Prochlorococcus marinus]|uniref:Aminotransferase n=1 Tax=Prochlorococcus marinus (strain MIT 9211) TaxID=93059 RepID=A9BA56_PROM4|nr:pyridoxal phosphate-dependent aminotransferase [Prochlorococcus marinus]ABX08718.1 Aminotransferase class-I [Prochlorococcus marinus str. MIT 9211]